MQKKKILIVTNHYLPGYKAGGPIKSVSAICENLKNNFNITVMTLNHDFGEKELYKNIQSDKINILNEYKVLYLSKIKLFNIKKHIDSINPEIIYLNSFFSKFTIFILLLKKFSLINARIILAPRGEVSSGALSLKNNKKDLFLKLTKIINLYNKNVLFHSTDKIESNDIKNLFNNKIVEIANLSNLIVSKKIIDKKQNELKIVFLSRISEKKNLLYALEVLKDIDKLNIIFDIYGPKEELEYWQKCNKVIESFKNVQIHYKGSIEPMEIPKILSQYHIFFLPTKNENFGHAIVEAMQSGLIPLISDQTPWNDLEKYNAGYSLDLEKKDTFVGVIKIMIDYTQEEFIEKSNNIRIYIDKKLDNKMSVNQYVKMFKDIVK